MATALKRLRENHEMRKQVLLVEDEPYSEMVITRILTRMGVPLDITWTKSVVEAEACLLRHHFDLIIADILLDGDATGMDFWRTCRVRFPETNFMVVSGLPPEHYLGSAEKDAAVPPFIAKPVDVERCAKMIGAFLTPSKPVPAPPEDRQL